MIPDDPSRSAIPGKRGVYYVLQIELSGVAPKNRARERDRSKIPGLYRMQGIVSAYSIWDNVQLQWGYGATENCASKRSNARLEKKNAVRSLAVPLLPGHPRPRRFSEENDPSSIAGSQLIYWFVYQCVYLVGISMSIRAPMEIQHR